MGGTYVFDIESDGFLEEITKVHCLVAIDIATQRVHRFSPNDIRSGLELLSQADHLIAHNGIGFDYPALRKLYPDIELPALTDTLIMSRMIYSDMFDIDCRKRDANPNYELPGKLFGSHKLEAWGYRLGDYKGDFDGGDWQTYSPEMLEYCEQDCWVTVKLYRHLLSVEHSRPALELEHKFATIIERQSQRGWAFDEEAAVKLYAELVGKRSKINDQMTSLFKGWWIDMKTPEDYSVMANDGYKSCATTKTQLTAYLRKEGRSSEIKDIKPGKLRRKHTPFNPASRHHIYKVFKEKYNWEPTEFTKKGGVKIDDTILQKLKYPEAKVLAEYFLLNKLIGQIAEGDKSWLKHVRDGRIHGYINTLGAVTHRCTHAIIVNVPASGVPYGKECRSLFITSKGMVLVGADASGLELRCLAHYMAHWDGGKYAKVLLEGDIHTENQKAAGLPTRSNAKTFIYAFLYGAGDGKIGSIVGSGRKTGKTLKARFLKTLPALNSLVKMVKEAAKKGHIKGLDGRKLTVRHAHASLNTLLQSCGAIVMKYALVESDRLIREAGYTPGVDYEFVGNIHDEMQLECYPEIADEIGGYMVQAIRNATNHFNFGCPLDGEYKKGRSWSDTH